MSSSTIKTLLPIPFTKMSGTGNDFIIIDHRTGFLDGIDLQEFARAVCRHKFSVGADGLILIENDVDADFRWQFFNADGSIAEMCGNGARCAARFAYKNGIAPAKMRFATIAGTIQAEVKADAVSLLMTQPTNAALGQTLGIDDREVSVHSINTGVPHAVLFVDDVDAAPVFEWGRLIRFHEMYQPAGTNVNFAQRTGDNSLRVRTYERGVEAETLACGTGAVASAIVGSLLGKVVPPVSVTTSGGDELVIHFTEDKKTNTVPQAVFLEGPAEIVCEGQLQEGAFCGSGITV